MTYAADKLESGRRPITTATLVLDKCANTYGVAPCTAAAATGQECFNTFQTCQDTANYDGSGTLEVTLTDLNGDVLEAPTATPGDVFIPCMQSLNIAPEKITPGKGIGQRGSITLSCLDFPHHDIGLDPYVANRAYTPVEQGTFFGKLLARNPHYTGRSLKLRQYFHGGGRTTSDYRELLYLIDAIDGPDAGGRVRITAKDPLILTENKKAQCPQPSTGTLSANLAAGTTSTFSLNTGEGANYPAGACVLRINDELIEITSRTSDTFTIASRGYGGTTADDHSQDDTVQLCYVADGTSASRVDLVLADLLQNYADVPAGYIPTTEWDAEADTWANGYYLDAIISEPTAVDTLLSEICVETNSVMWWSPIEQEIKWRTQTPDYGTLETLYDKSLIEGKAAVSIKQGERVSQVLYYCNVRNWTESLEPKNYRELVVRQDATGESADAYDSPAIKKIYARWLQSSSLTGEVASRYLSRFKKPPEVLTAEVDLKDIERLPVGDHIILYSSLSQDHFGAINPVEMQIMSAQHDIRGETVKLSAMRYRYDAERYCKVAPTGTADYTSATGAVKAVYGFICSTSGVQMSNGDDPYLIT